MNYSQKGVKKVNITFIDRDGDRIKVAAKVGDTLLDVAKDNDIQGVSKVLAPRISQSIYYIAHTLTYILFANIITRQF